MNNRKDMSIASFPRSQTLRGRLRNASLPLFLLCLLLLPGCEQTVVYLSPYLLAHQGKLICAVQTTTPGEQRAQYAVFMSEGAPHRQWSEHGRFFGRLAGLLPGEKTIRFVFQDGAIQEHPIEMTETEFATRLQGRGDMQLETVARIGNTVFAADASVSGSLRLLLLREDGWHPHGPPVSVFGVARYVQLVELEHQPTLLWRTELQGVREAGLQIWTLNDNEEWSPLPSPPGESERSVFAAVNKPQTEGIEFVRLHVRNEENAKLEAFYLEHGEWQRRQHAPPISDAYPYSQIFSLSLANTDTQTVLVQSDASGVQIAFSGETDETPWSVPVSVVFQETVDPDSAFGPLAAFLTGVILLVILRRWLQREQASSAKDSQAYTGGLASPIDRGIALFFDLLLLMPFPLMFFQMGVDVPPLVSVSRNPVLIFLLWMGGMAMYGAITERIWGQTLGKRLMRLRVCHVRGGRVSTGQTLLRNICRFVDFYPVPVGGATMPYLIALLTSSLSRQRQRVGDWLAGTIVLKYIPLEKRQVVLASASPRRRELLDGLGLRFEVDPADIPEIAQPGMPPDAIALDLARRKAMAVANRLDGAQVVIAADTLVALDERIIGKPADDEDARNILRELSGRMHQIYSGVAIIDRATGQTLSAVERTDVRMRELTAQEIDDYVASGEATGKAGAYAIQENADRFVTEVRGSTSNVIGLPMELLTQMLNELDG